MPDEQFDFMKRIISAPSPIGLEASMTQGIIAPEFESFGARDLGWTEHKFRGNAGTVWDTGAAGADDDSEQLTVMICGHADKIRMQVRSISPDGKVWINSDSFLPLTLLGNEVTLFSEDPQQLGSYRSLPGTVEALGAIHFAPPEARSGKKGIAPTELYLELGLHGSRRKEQLTQLGVRPGDTILLDRPITRCVGGETFSGAYLDNGLGCFVAAEVARKVAASPELTKHVRCLFAFASHEEIGAERKPRPHDLSLFSFQVPSTNNNSCLSRVGLDKLRSISLNWMGTQQNQKRGLVGWLVGWLPGCLPACPRRTVRIACAGAGAAARCAHRRGCQPRL